MNVGMEGQSSGSQGIEPQIPLHKGKKIQKLLQQVEKEPTNSSKSEVMDHLIWGLFERCRPVEGKEEIIVTGHVLGDGRGDWFAMLHTCKQLQKKFPDRVVRLIATSDELWRGKLTADKLKAVDLAFTGEHSGIWATGVTEKTFPPEAEVLRKAKEAGVILSVNIGIPQVYKSIQHEIEGKSLQILEYDIDTAIGGFGSPKHQMGIDPAQGRRGIFVSSTKKDYAWHDLQNKFLKALLFGNDAPTKEAIETYLSSHICFLGYMKELMPLIFFIHDAVSFARANAETKSIDICLPGFCKRGQDNIDRRLELIKGENFGISRVKIIWNHEGEQLERVVILGEGNNEIRIIDPGNLSGKDFKIMTRISAPLVGCTGDNSLAQALSYGKIPCYEKRKREVSIGVLKRIEANFGKESPLYKYFSDTDGSVILPGLAEQASRLGEIIREEASFNPILKGIVNERLFRQKDPEFASKEDQIRQEYLNSSILIEEVEKRLMALLVEKGMLPRGF